MVEYKKFGEYFTERLHSVGIHHLFSVPGDFNLGLLDYFIESKIEYIGCCNELNAGYAADGYARLNGIGAVLTTYAVGELSSLNALAGSYAECIPVISIGGIPKREFWKTRPLLHHTLGDYAIPMKCLGEVTVKSVVIDNPLTAARDLDEVLAKCILMSQPVYIGIPSDMPDEMIPMTEGPWTPPIRPASDPDALQECLDEIIPLITNAVRPVLIPGYEIHRRHLNKEFEKLTSISKIPYTTMLLSKGVISESHRNFIGLYNGARSSDAIRGFVDKADCVVILGEKLTDFNTGGFTANFKPNHTIAVEYAQTSIGHHTYNNVMLPDLLAGLITRLTDLPEKPHPVALEECLHHKDSVCSETGTNKITNDDLFNKLARWLPPKSVVIAETGNSMFSVARLMLPDEAIFIAQTFYGSIGYTVGACLGASVAVKSKDPDRRVVLCVGDGSFQLTCQELSTMIRYKLNPVIVLLNNDGYTIERVITDNIYNNINMWRYASLPVVFNGDEGIVVRTYDDMDNAINEIDARPDRLVFLEVILDRFDCDELLKEAGALMAKNNNLTQKVLQE